MPKYFLNYAGCLLLLFFQVAQAAPTAVTSLENESLRLEFDLSSGAVRHWFLSGFRNTDGAAQDMVGPDGQLFALNGMLAGKDVGDWAGSAGGWKVLEQRPDLVVLGLAGPNQPFIIKKSWRLTGGTWRTDFSLDLEFREGRPSPADYLELAVGPGIGETPAHGLGMGQNIYSFTELVYRDESGVNTRRLDGEGMSFSASTDMQADWVGLQSRYFALILAPEDNATHQLSWRANVPQATVLYPGYPDFETSVSISLPISESSTDQVYRYSWKVFGGGKRYQELTDSNPDLGGLLFSGLWGWMRALSLATMQILKFIESIVGSWGLAIILLAGLVRVVMYPIATRVITAQKKFAVIQARLQPELQRIRRDYKGGEQSERILQLYEAHKVSPLAGLKPLLIVLIQVPVFVSLYHLLGQTFELRDASFLWIETLSRPDQLFSLGVDLPLFGSYFNLLPVLMAFTTLLSIKFAEVTDSTGSSLTKQRVMSGLMGLVFFLLFYSFPSGMVLYWTVANILQVLHQKLVEA